MSECVVERGLGGPTIGQRVLTLCSDVSERFLTADPDVTPDPDGRARTNDRPALTTGPTGCRRFRHQVSALPETGWIGILAVALRTTGYGGQDRWRSQCDRRLRPGCR